MKALKWLGLKLSSRKFHVFVIATVAFFKGILSQNHWTFLACAYISLNFALLVLKLIAEMKKGKDE